MRLAEIDTQAWGEEKFKCSPSSRWSAEVRRPQQKNPEAIWKKQKLITDHMFPPPEEEKPKWEQPRTRTTREAEKKTMKDRDIDIVVL